MVACSTDRSVTPACRLDYFRDALNPPGIDARNEIQFLKADPSVLMPARPKKSPVSRLERAH
jgi:hypothetical protein